jgi:predicted Rossmann fold flavoprotein
LKKTANVIIVGGGAAGFFTAINIAEKDPDLKIIILERSKEVLTKVKISGGGRCNVTHAQFDPKELTLNYPRGEKEMLGPFHRFMTGDTMEWFAKRDIELKIEDDGRIFPVSDSSQTIVDCFVMEAERRGVEVLKKHSVKSIKKLEDQWSVRTSEGDYVSDKLVVTTGSNEKIWALLENLGHTIVPSVPSLFTFNIEDERISNLPGISTQASVNVLDGNGKSILDSEGSLLITHWGISGPVILKLSAWGALQFHELDYQFKIKVNWLPDYSEEKIRKELRNIKKEFNKKSVTGNSQFELPKRLWKSILRSTGIPQELVWAELTNLKLQKISEQLTRSVFEVNGKSTYKEEFVTAGGVDLREVNFKRFESKIHKNLFFAGEVLNIDAITGGFNFQNAWSGGYIAAQAIIKND